MSNDSNLTRRQAFWLGHLRACGKGSLKAYAEANGLEVRALYDAKARLKRTGLLANTPARFARVQRETPGAAPTVCRIHLRNGTVVEMACAPEHWPRLLDSVAALS